MNYICYCYYYTYNLLRKKLNDIILLISVIILQIWFYKILRRQLKFSILIISQPFVDFKYEDVNDLFILR